MMWGTGGSLAELARWVRQDGTGNGFRRTRLLEAHGRALPTSQVVNFINSTGRPTGTETSSCVTILRLLPQSKIFERGSLQQNHGAPS
jgi:hypothetical protein